MFLNNALGKIGSPHASKASSGIHDGKPTKRLKKALGGIAMDNVGSTGNSNMDTLPRRELRQPAFGSSASKAPRFNGGVSGPGALKPPSPVNHNRYANSTGGRGGRRVMGDHTTTQQDEDRGVMDALNIVTSLPFKKGGRAKGRQKKGWGGLISGLASLLI